MTTNLSVTPRPEIARDRWDRPLVIPPEGGSALPYTRCTTFVGSIEDTYNLSRWQQRMVAVGLSQRPDLVLAAAAHRTDRDKLNGIVEDAMEAAAAHAGATTGTALHAMAETYDRGEDVGVVPAAYQADLDAYVEATADFTATHIEQFTVHDPWRIGGTPDRVVNFNGQRYIADIKTGDIKWGYLKMAAQLAVYARSKTYDVATGARGMHGADLQRGIIIHLPAGTGTCDLYWIDLVQGWECVKLCRQVRGMRSMKVGQIMMPFGQVLTPFVPLKDNRSRAVEDVALPGMEDDGGTVNVEAANDRATATDATGQGHYTLTPSRPAHPTLEDRLAACTTRAEVEALWRDNEAGWTDQLTELAKRHIAAITQ
jgi:hypothetical protein